MPERWHEECYLEWVSGGSQLLTELWQQRGEVGQPEKVARLGGAIGGLADFAGSKSPMLVQPILSYYKEAIEMAQSNLVETAYNEAFAKGELMSLEEAIVYARQVLTEINP